MEHRLRSQAIEIDLDSLIDDRLPAPEEVADIRALGLLFSHLLAQLPPKYAEILKLLYGLESNRPALSQSEAARVLHCSAQRIACLRCMAISRLAARFGDRLRPYATWTISGP